MLLLNPCPYIPMVQTGNYYGVFEDFGETSTKLRKTRWEIGSAEQWEDVSEIDKDFLRVPGHLGSRDPMFSKKYEKCSRTVNNYLGCAQRPEARAISAYLMRFGVEDKIVCPPQFNWGPGLNPENFTPRVPLKRKSSISCDGKNVKLRVDSSKNVKLRVDSSKTVIADNERKIRRVSRKIPIDRISDKSFSFKIDFLQTHSSEQCHKLLYSPESSGTKIKNAISAVLGEKRHKNSFIETMEYCSANLKRDPRPSILLSNLVPQKYLNAEITKRRIEMEPIKQKSFEGIHEKPINNKCLNLLFLWPTSDDDLHEEDTDKGVKSSVYPKKSFKSTKCEEDSLFFDLNISPEKKALEPNVPENIETSLKTMLSRCLSYIPAPIKHLDRALQTLIKSGLPGTKGRRGASDEHYQYDWASYAQISLLQNTLASNFKKKTSTSKNPPLWYGFTDAMLSVNGIFHSESRKEALKEKIGHRANSNISTLSAVIDWVGKSANLLKKAGSLSSEKTYTFEADFPLEERALTTLNKHILYHIDNETTPKIDSNALREPIDIKVLFTAGKDLFKEFAKDRNNRYKQTISFLLCDGSICKFSIPKEISTKYSTYPPYTSQSQKQFPRNSSFYSQVPDMSDKIPAHTSELFARFIRPSEGERYPGRVKPLPHVKGIGVDFKYHTKGKPEQNPHSLCVNGVNTFKPHSKPTGPPIPMPVETLARDASKCKLNVKKGVDTRWSSLISGLKEFSEDGKVELDCLVGDIYFSGLGIEGMRIPRLIKKNLLAAIDSGYQIRNFIVRDQANINSCISAVTSSVAKNLYHRFQAHVVMDLHMSSMINVKGCTYVFELLERFRANVTSQPKLPITEAYKKLLISNAAISDVREVFDFRGSDTFLEDAMFDCLFAEKTLSTLWRFPNLVDYSRIYDAHKALCVPGVRAAMRDIDTHDHSFIKPPQLEPYTERRSSGEHQSYPKTYISQLPSMKYSGLFSSYSKPPLGAGTHSIGVGSNEGYANRLTQDCLEYYASRFRAKSQAPLSPKAPELIPCEANGPPKYYKTTAPKYSKDDNTKDESIREPSLRYTYGKLDETQHSGLGSFFSHREDLGVHSSVDNIQSSGYPSITMVSSTEEINRAPLNSKPTGEPQLQLTAKEDCDKVTDREDSIQPNSEQYETSELQPHAYLYEQLKSYPEPYPELRNISPIEDAKEELIEYVKLSLKSEDGMILKELKEILDDLTPAMSPDAFGLPEPTNMDATPAAMEDGGDSEFLKRERTHTDLVS